MTYAGGKLYRSRNGMMLGICQGIADWKDMPVSIVRLIFIIIGGVTAIAPCLIIYLIAGFIIPVEPAYREREYNDRHEHRNDRHNHHRHRDSRYSRMDDIREDFEDLKSRVNKMEDEETGDKESDWDRRFHDGK